MLNINFIQKFRDRLKAIFQQFSGTSNLFFQVSTESNQQKQDLASELELQPIRPRVRFAEWALLFFVVVLYLSSYLQSTPEYRLPGNEQPIIQSFGQIFTKSLQQGYFPLWNPYMSTGFPYFADPILYIYNPFISLPMVLFGYENGFVYAVLIALLIGVYGMWWLARQFDLGSAGRIWSALMFILAGTLIIRFSQGQYLLVFGYCWLPWGIGTILRVLRFGRLKDIAFSAIILSLLYFCGNLYYAYYLVFIGALATIIYSVDLQRIKPFVRIRLLPIRNLMLTGILIFGLVSLHLIPLIEFSPRIVKGVNLEFTDSHSLPQILLDYTSKDKSRPDAIETLPPEDFYGYVGWWPFLALVTLPFAWKEKRKRVLVFFIGVFILSVLWIDIREMPWREIYHSQHFLQQFRYPTRMLALGTLSLILLGGFGIDSVWKRMLNLRQTNSQNWRGLLATGLMGCLIIFALVSIGDLFTTNESVTSPAEYPTIPDQVLTDLRDYDSGTYYISAPANWHEHTVNFGMRYWDAWYPAGDIVNYDGMINKRGFIAGPKYRIIGSNDPAPDNSTLIINSATFSIYEINSSLPFSFSIPTNTLMVETGQPIQPADVIEQPAITEGPNQVAIDVDNDDTPSTLVTLTRNYPGWQVSVDGQPSKLVTVSGYTGTPIQPGLHHYVFTFQPTSFYVGLVISIISLILALAMLGLGSWVSLSGLGLKERLEKVKTYLKEYQSRKALTSQTILKTDSTLASKTNAITAAKTGVILAQRRAEENRSLTITDADGETIKVDVHLDMPRGTRVRLIVEALENDGTSGERVEFEGSNNRLSSESDIPMLPADSAPPIIETRTPIQSGSPKFGLPTFDTSALKTFWERIENFGASHKWTLGAALFTLAVIVYLITHLTALESFPIYFFSDEASQTLYAQRLIDNHFVDANNQGIPIYVEADANRWTPLIPMYFHAIAVLMFGKSIIETRATSALISLLAGIAISLILKYVFKKRYWWAGILVAAVIPAWFLHSRTAFETVMTTAFYGMFLLFYLLYRYKDARYLYVAVVFAGLTFYSYSNAQAVMGTVALLLLISDIRYHWQNRKTVIIAVLMVIVLALPLINFEMKKPDALGKHLQAVNSYWFQNISFTEKIQTFFGQYIYGLSPQYWVIPNSQDIVRHQMDGMGNIPMWMFPFIVIGALVALRHIKEPMYRTLILSAIATPVGGAMLQIGITRVLTFIVPASILAVLGFEWLLDLIQNRWERFPKAAFQVVVFITLATTGFWMLRTAIVEGPLWSSDYGLYGMQWGAKEIFVDSVQEFLKRDPNTRLLISSSWANGTEKFIAFFVSPNDTPRVTMAGIDTYINRYTNIGPGDIFVLTPNEYQHAIDSKEFKPPVPEKILNYPDGNPGFYFVHLTYVDNVQQLMDEEKKARLVLVTDDVMMDGQMVKFSHSQLDTGQVLEALDGDTESLMRGATANPFIIDIEFPEPRTISGFSGVLGSMNYLIKFDLYAPGSNTPVHYETSRNNVTSDPLIEVKFDKGPATVQRIYVEITNPDQPLNDTNIHIRELKFLP